MFRPLPVFALLPPLVALFEPLPLPAFFLLVLAAGCWIVDEQFEVVFGEVEVGDWVGFVLFVKLLLLLPLTCNGARLFSGEA
jgi:hypothetical protein